MSPKSSVFLETAFLAPGIESLQSVLSQNSEEINVWKERTLRDSVKMPCFPWQPVKTAREIEIVPKKLVVCLDTLWKPSVKLKSYQKDVFALTPCNNRPLNWNHTKMTFFICVPKRLVCLDTLWQSSAKLNSFQKDVFALTLFGNRSLHWTRAKKTCLFRNPVKTVR